MFQIRAQRRTQKTERGEGEKTGGQRSAGERRICRRALPGLFPDPISMFSKKSGGETETWPRRSVRVPAIRSGITVVTGNDRNETDTERGGVMGGRKRKDEGTEAAGRKLQPKLRSAFA